MELSFLRNPFYGIVFRSTYSAFVHLFEKIRLTYFFPLLVSFNWRKFRVFFCPNGASRMQIFVLGMYLQIHFEKPVSKHGAAAVTSNVQQWKSLKTDGKIRYLEILVALDTDVVCFPWELNSAVPTENRSTRVIIKELVCVKGWNKGTDGDNWLNTGEYGKLRSAKGCISTKSRAKHWKSAWSGDPLNFMEK